MATDSIVDPAPPPPAPAASRPPRVGSVAQLVVAIAVVLAIAYYARLVLITIFVSVLLAFMLAPVVELLERIRLPRAVAAFAAVVILLSGMYGLTYVSYASAAAFMEELPKYTTKIRTSLTHFQKRAAGMQKTAEDILPDDPDQRRTVRVRQERDWSDVLTNAAGTLTDLVLALSFIPFLIYFMLTWQGHVRSATVMLFKMEHRNTAYATLGHISAMIRSFIVGNVVIGAFMAVLSVLFFGLMGLPYFYFVGIVSGFLSLVPYLGVVLALLPPLLAAIGVASGPKLAAIVGVVLVLHLFALNVLYPKILGRRLQLNPLVVTIALLTWGWIWGAMGLILAVPIAGAMKIIFDHVDSLRPYGAWMGE